MIVWMLWSVLFSGLVGLTAVALERVASFCSVPRRYVWMAAVTACGLVPVVLATRTRAPAVATLPAPRGAVTAVSQVAVAASITPPSEITRTVRRATVVTAFVDVWAGGVWLLMSSIVLIGFVRSTRMLSRRRAQWRKTELGSFSALVAPDAGPAVIGFAHPQIVIPEWALTLERRTQEMMLRHELEHIRTGDPRTLLAALLLLVAFPWNAALWGIVRRLRLAMEIDCDTRVVRAIGESHDYGMVLLAVGERFTTPLPLAASLAGPRPFLERRINAMTAQRPRRPLLASLPFVAIAALIMTAATSAPRPVSFGSMAQLRGPKPFPTREAIHGVVGENFPAIANGSDTSQCLVLVYDSDNNFVRGIPAVRGFGSVMISVSGDTLTTPEARRRRRELRLGGSNEPLVEQGVVGGGGRGGRGGAARSGAARSGAGGTSGAQSVERGRVTGTATASGELIADGSLQYSRHAASYVTGWTHTKIEEMRPRTLPRINEATGLMTPGKDGESGIAGILAVHVASVESLSFAEGQLAPGRVHVLVVSLVPASRTPAQ